MTRTMTKPTQKKKPSKLAVEEMITKGAAKPLAGNSVLAARFDKIKAAKGQPVTVAVTPENHLAEEKPKRNTAKPGYKQINIPLLESEIEQINRLRELREKPRGSTKLGISLQNWIVEAVGEKLIKDNAANGL